MRRTTRPWRLNRRRFLQLSGAGAAGLALSSCSLDETNPDCPIDPDGPHKSPEAGPSWLRHARVAGIEAYVGQTACELKPILDELADEHVSVVEVDPELSAYLTEEEFASQVKLLDLIAKGCHMRGMRAVAYYPTLEVLTSNAENVPHTMHKDHPDWVQISIDGKPNVFVGGGGRVFWVEPGQESAWLCPSTGYRDYFNKRVVALAGTALDGVWGDVPLFSDIVGVWPCVCPVCKSRFKQDTGLGVPVDVNWNDPGFRRWIEWRHHVIWDFEQQVVKAAKAARSDFEVIIETVTMDYNAGTVQGLDGASADDGKVYRVWEVDAVSDATAMRHADADDWISMAVMMRHGRCASAPRPSWIFSYGLEEDDAEHVMALAVVTGNNPYESKIPVMNTRVSHEYRKRMFGWLERNVAIYDAQSVNSTAVIFSSASRDFLDRNSGVGLYTSLNPSDKLWWSTRQLDSAKELAYLGDYRGMCKTLIHAHIPHDVVTSPHATDDVISRYKLLVAPSLVAVSDELATRLEKWVNQGGTLVLTGADAGSYDEVGNQRLQPKLVQLFGITPASGWTQMPHGKGNVLHTSDRAGKTFFNTNDPTILDALTTAAKLAGGLQVVVEEGPAPLLFDLRRTAAGALQLLVANLDGLGQQGVGKYTPRDAEFDVALDTGGRVPKKVTLSVPDKGIADRSVSFTTENGQVCFSLKERSLALATVEL
jgi:hypothetical protein